MRILAALLAALLPVALLAGPGMGPGPGHHDAAGPGGDHTAAMLEHMTYRLELTPEQQQEVQRIMDALQPRFEKLHEQMTSAQSGLFDAVHADPLNEAAIREASAAVAAVDADLNVAKATMLQEIRAMLTPEQRTEATEMISEMKAYHADHPGGGHGGATHPRRPDTAR